MMAKGFSGRKFPQHQHELDQLLDLVRKEGVKRYLEIGARWGDSMHAVGSAMPKGSEIVVVDIQAITPHLAAQTKAANDLRRKGRVVTLIKGNSRDRETIERAAFFAPYDLILIDGDHSLKGVTADWNNYGAMGRMVAFHDIIAERWQVKPLWDEIKLRHRHVEFVADSAMGIGVIFR